MSNRTGKIQTVLGLIEPAELGFTQTHEHLLCSLIPAALREEYVGEPITLENVGYLRKNWLANPENLHLSSEPEAIDELNLFKQSGGGAIVELTVIGIGRDPEGLARISRATGVHVVMGAGFYNAGHHPPEIANLSEEEICKMLVDELDTGVGDSGIRPGIIGEIGLDWPVYDSEAKVLRAAAMAQRATGAALNIHPGRAPEAPLDAIRIVKEAGGDPERTVMSHIDRTLFTNDDVLALAETGCYIEYDLFAQESSYYPITDIDMPNDGTRVDKLIMLIRHGYRDKLLVSMDICHKTQLSTYGGEGYSHILDYVLPIMRRKGMTSEDIDAITVRNPARMLAFV
jgi:phosphotriesterase-related protein